MFNYSDNTVGIVNTGTTPTSPISAADMSPDADTANSATSTLTVDTGNLYYDGGIGIGALNSL